MSTASLILVIPILCIVVALCAMLGDRIARRGHRIVALGVNACGYVALVAGVVLVIGFFGLARHHVRVRFPRVTVLRHALPHESPSTVIIKNKKSGDAQQAKRAEKPAKSSPPGATKSTSPDVTDKKPAQAEKADDPTSATPVEPGSDKPEFKNHDVPSAVDDAAAKSKSGPTSARDLELMPQAFIDFDARPDWVESKEEDLGPVHRIAVSSGPFMRVREADEELTKQLKLETDRYISRLVGNEQAADRLNYDADEIRARFVAPECIYTEKVVSPSFGVMQQSHALLQFGPDFRHEVNAGWQDLLAHDRLVQVGIVAAGILGVLSILFGYFRIDTATRGFYTGRLRFATAVAILGLIGASVFLARSIPWFRL